jgi:isoleucyl-tRNA synthetase
MSIAETPLALKKTVNLPKTAFGQKANLAQVAGAAAGVQVKVERAEGEKCERCWNYSVRVGESKRYPTACEHCVEALKEIEREEEAS